MLRGNTYALLDNRILAKTFVAWLVVNAFDPNRTRMDGHGVCVESRIAENICDSNSPLLGNCRALD
jgi:hypothetical protein